MPVLVRFNVDFRPAIFWVNLWSKHTLKIRDSACQEDLFFFFPFPFFFFRPWIVHTPSQ